MAEGIVDIQWDRWTKAAQLQIEYIKASAEAAKNQAEANLTKAKADGVRTGIIVAETALGEALRIWDGLARNRYKTSHAIALIQNKARDLSRAVRGNGLDKALVAAAWHAYRFFQRATMLSGEEWIERYASEWALPEVGSEDYARLLVVFRGLADVAGKQVVELETALKAASESGYKVVPPVELLKLGLDDCK